MLSLLAFAADGATALLVLATLLYYLLVLVVSRRRSGASLEDGTSANLQGLRSVAIDGAVRKARGDPDGSEAGGVHERRATAGVVRPANGSAARTGEELG